MSSEFFYERQSYHSAMIWVIGGMTTLVLGGLSITGIYVQIIQQRPFGNHPMTDTGLIIFSLGCLVFNGLLIWLLINSALEFKVDRLGITYRLSPFMRRWKTIYRESITHWSINEKQLTGYGFQYRPKGRIYYIKGDKLLTIQTQGGKSISFSTEKAREAEHAMKRMIEREPQDI